MAISDLVDFPGDGAVRVTTKSGKLYDVERDVILANAREDNPIIYGWPVVPRWHRSHGRVRWFRADNVQVVQ